MTVEKNACLYKGGSVDTQINDAKPETYLVDVVRLQQHLPQQTEEQWG